MWSMWNDSNTPNIQSVWIHLDIKTYWCANPRPRSVADFSYTRLEHNLDLAWQGSQRGSMLDWGWDVKICCGQVWARLNTSWMHRDYPDFSPLGLDNNKQTFSKTRFRPDWVFLNIMAQLVYAHQNNTHSEVG